jgi:hypothetical protein
MRIIVYPETVDNTIGRFDEPDVKTCILVKISPNDLFKFDEIFRICAISHSPTAYIHNIANKVTLAKPMEEDIEKWGEDHLFMRIDKATLLACIPEDRNLTEEMAIECLRDDIRQMIYSANLYMETFPEEMFWEDDVFLKEPIAILSTLATAMELVLTDGVPLINRFDTLESEGDDRLQDFDEAIKALKSYEG